jgi:hypothetical protein
VIAPDAVTVTTVVSVDPDTAFSVFTEEIDAWWQRGGMYRVRPDRKSIMRFEPGVGGRLVEEYAGSEADSFALGRVKVWEPGRRLVFSMGGRDFGPGEETEVEVRFEEDASGTRVTLEHRGWGAFPRDHPVRHGLVGEAFSNLMGTWWANLLVSMRAYVRRHPRDGSS